MAMASIILQAPTQRASSSLDFNVLNEMTDGIIFFSKVADRNETISFSLQSMN